MACPFEVYSRYFDAAAEADSERIRALWEEAADLRPLESMVAAEALEDREQRLPKCGQTHFCRTFHRKCAREKMDCASCV